MGLKKIVSALLPKSKVKAIRYRYYMLHQRFHKPMSEEFFRNMLIQKFGVNRGDTLFIHSSIDFLNIDFSPIRLIHILMEVIGKDGTLVFPAWHIMERAEEYLCNENNIFDMKRSPSVLGLLPELARRMPGACRSIHPINSIVAIGKNAEDIVSAHECSIYPCGESSPYYKMLKYDAKIIGLGVNANFFSFVHCPEDIMKDEFPVQTRTEQTYKGKVRLLSGEIIEVETLAAHKNIGHRNIPAYMGKYMSRDIYVAYKIRGCHFYVANANPLFHRMIELAKEGITIYNS